MSDKVVVSSIPPASLANASTRVLFKNFSSRGLPQRLLVWAVSRAVVPAAIGGVAAGFGLGGFDLPTLDLTDLTALAGIGSRFGRTAAIAAFVTAEVVSDILGEIAYSVDTAKVDKTAKKL